MKLEPLDPYRVPCRICAHTWTGAIERGVFDQCRTTDITIVRDAQRRGKPAPYISRVHRERAEDARTWVQLGRPSLIPFVMAMRLLMAYKRGFAYTKSR